MNARARQGLSALGVVAVVAAGLGGAALGALSLRAAQAEVAALDERAQALQAREKRLFKPERDRSAPASFEARSVTQAGAALQSRVEAAVAAAKGRLSSAKVDVEARAAERRIGLAAELTIAEPDMQALLFDLETRRPYVFVDSFEARTSEDGAMRVSLNLSGQWSTMK